MLVLSVFRSNSAFSSGINLFVIISLSPCLSILKEDSSLTSAILFSSCISSDSSVSLNSVYILLRLITSFSSSLVTGKLSFSLRSRKSLSPITSSSSSGTFGIPPSFLTCSSGSLPPLPPVNADRICAAVPFDGKFGSSIMSSEIFLNPIGSGFLKDSTMCSPNLSILPPKDFLSLKSCSVLLISSSSSMVIFSGSKII